MRIIKERGLRKHLREFVFIGDSEEAIYRFLLDGEENARRGKLEMDDYGFYICVSGRHDEKFTDDVKRVVDGSWIGIPPLKNGIFCVSFLSAKDLRKIVRLCKYKK